MSSAKKIQRKQTLEAKKNMTSELNMFDRLPNKCDTCHKDFDKKSKEMAQTWIVVVRNEQKLVRLFCPECVDKVKEHLPNEEA